MAKRLATNLLERVLAALRNHPQGLALRDLEAQLIGIASRYIDIGFIFSPQC